MRVKLRLGALAALALLIISLPARAAMRDIESVNNQISVLFQAQDMNHTETARGTVLNTEDAEISGYALSASVMKDLWLGRDYLAAEIGTVYGQSNYVGGTFANPAYGSYIGKSGARIGDFAFRYGSGYVIDADVLVTPYGELGYHKYDRTLGYGTSGSYLETYTHRYYGIGVRGQITPGDKSVWSVNALVGYTFGANIAVGLPAPSGFSTRLGNSALCRVGAALDYALAKNIHATIGVDFTSWKYGASAVQPLASGISLYEPDSKTSNTVIRAGVGYSF